MSGQHLYLNKCRTCLGEAKVMHSLEKLAGEKEKRHSYAEILKEIANVNVYDDKKEVMPQKICINCSRKLMSSHAFVKQAQEVNDKIWSLMKPTLMEAQKMDCLKESEIDIEKCLQIKMETECDENEDEMPRNTLELQSNVEPKIELKEIRAVCENVIGKTTKQIQRKGNYKGCQLEKLEVECDSKCARKELDNSNVVENTLIEDNISQANCHENSNLAMDDSTDNDSDDNTCLSLLKTDKLEEKGDDDEITLRIPRKRRKRIETKGLVENKNDDDIPVPCPKCDKIFNNSKALSTHLRYVHVPEDQKCSCPLCGATFTRNCSMYTHIRTLHGKEYLNVILPPKERLHECEKCHRKYASKKYLKYHIKMKHNRDVDNAKKLPGSENDGMQSENKIRPLCPMCGVSFCNKVQLEIHVRRHTGEKPFKCEQCDKSFLQKTDLKIHRRLHTGEKPYKCKICEKAFRVSTKLKNHLRSHTDERPYQCSQCERSFKYSKDLNIHNRIHTGERPYSCNVCGSTFTQSNSLKTHRQKLGHI